MSDRIPEPNMINLDPTYDSSLFLCLLLSSTVSKQGVILVDLCAQAQRNVSVLVQEWPSAKGKHSHWVTLGENVQKYLEGDTFPKAFFGNGRIISLVVNFYPVKQHVFPAHFCSFLAQANGA